MNEFIYLSMPFIRHIAVTNCMQGKINDGKIAERFLPIASIISRIFGPTGLHNVPLGVCNLSPGHILCAMTLSFGLSTKALQATS